MGKHDATLAAIYAKPTRANIRWADIESLLESCGAEVSEGSGSRVRVALNGVRSTFHRPHPRPEVGKKVVEAVRDFLTQAGVEP